jgi:two-component system, LytTR family, response regulator
VIRAVIVDDEPLARAGIRALLGEVEEVVVEGEAGNGLDAVKLISAQKPDVVFLDVQMPNFDGFEVLRRVMRTHLPLVVFVTAHDTYACQAFDAQAIDYVLKPITRDRFRQALERVLHHVGHEGTVVQAHRRLIQFLDSFAGPAFSEADRRIVRWFTVKDRESFRVVRTEDVSYVTSALNYVELHVRDRTYMVRMTMNELESRLDPTSFVRIHRRAIVNVAWIETIDRTEHGESVKLKDGAVLPLGRGYRDRLIQ